MTKQAPDKSSPRIALRGKLLCKNEQERALVELHLAEHISLTRAEAGCLRFEVTADPYKPFVFIVEEIFANKDAFDKHQLRTKNSRWGEATIAIKRDYRVTEIKQ